jgi:hypothetical protein
LRLGVSLLVSVALLTQVGVARAAEPVDDSERNAARNLAEQGRDAFDKGDFARSLDLFHRAYDLVQAPTLALYEARSLAKLGRLVEAEEAYLRAIRAQLGPGAPEAFRKAVRDAGSEALQLGPRVPKVTIVLAGPGAQLPELRVTLNRERVKSALLGVEMPIDPGTHELEAQSPGGEVARVRFAIDERERKTVELRVSAPASVSRPAVRPTPRPTPTPSSAPRSSPEPQPSSWHRPGALAAGGLALVGVGTGIVAGVMASSKHADAERECPNRACVEGTEGADSLSAFRSLRTVSTIGYVVGAAGVAAGLTFLLTAPSPRGSSRAAVGVWVGASGAGVTGAF